LPEGQFNAVPYLSVFIINFYNVHIYVHNHVSDLDSDFFEKKASTQSG